MHERWLGPALVVVLGVTAARVALLALNGTDLFVDEAQYWLWGQNLDWGYYSKPPLIAWVIRASTELAGSDDAFWVRLPAALFHATTALILARIAAGRLGPRAALWTAAIYVTLPFVALGSLLISTDTILAPFWAAALLFHLRLLDAGKARDALLTGAMIGLATMAKYAGVYLLLCILLAAAFLPRARPGWRNLILILGAFAVVVAPNAIWNLTHGLATVEHTMDNAAWVREERVSLNWTGAAEFLGTQFAVFGPVAFAILMWLWLRARGPDQALFRLFSLPILALVTVQAVLSGAYPNWAVTAYFAGTLMLSAWVADRGRRGWALIGPNLAVAAVLPLLTVFPQVTLGRDEPLLARYLGRAELSRQILSAAHETGATAIVAGNRDVLADLFHTGRDAGVAVFALPPEGRPMDYYQETFAFPAGDDAPVLVIRRSGGMRCDGARVEPVRVFDLSGGAYAGRDYAAYLVPGHCVPGA